MRLYRSLASLEGAGTNRRRVAAIGAFDGMHLGHREIVAQALAIARERKEPAIVITFEPTPSEFFARGEPPARLTCFRERFDLLAGMGVDEMFCPQFGSVRTWTAGRFVEEVLQTKLNVSDLVVGHDFRLGAGREGTLAWLVENAPARGFEVCAVSAVEIDGRRVSSTAIRGALAAGKLARAKGMLGRDYSMSGRVIHGRGIGRDLGFPTANVNLKRRLAPIDGIFAVTVDGVADRALHGVASVGSRPTIGAGETLLEVFIFDFDEDIYGRYITVNFIERLREERKYPDLESMQQQMHVDVVDAQAALKRRIA
jgi:riboflavin kinase/FMN adenylyltransferase